MTGYISSRSVRTALAILVTCYAAAVYRFWTGSRDLITNPEVDRITAEDLPTSLSALSSASASSIENMASRSLTQLRALAAITGGFVADAATMGLHWIYDPAKLQSLVDSTGGKPEFFSPPACPFYEYKSGALSPYGDEILPLLQDVATRGEFNAPEFALVSYHAAKTYTGRLNQVFKELVRKGDEGLVYPDLASPSKDIHGGIKVPILVARYLNEPIATLLKKVREATKVHEESPEPEDAAVASALLLQQVVAGVSVNDAIASLASNEEINSSTRAEIQDVLDSVKAKTFPDATTAVGQFGKSCTLPGVLKGLLYVLLTTNDYSEAIRVNMAAGGDNCSRSIIIGAVYAAASASADGKNGIPEVWKSKTTRYTEIDEWANKVVSQA